MVPKCSAKTITCLALALRRQSLQDVFELVRHELRDAAGACRATVACLRRWYEERWGSRGRRGARALGSQTAARLRVRAERQRAARGGCRRETLDRRHIHAIQCRSSIGAGPNGGPRCIAAALPL